LTSLKSVVNIRVNPSLAATMGSDTDRVRRSLQAAAA
jgi:hypothetical protein